MHRPFTFHAAVPWRCHLLVNLCVREYLARTRRLKLEPRGAVCRAAAHLSSTVALRLFHIVTWPIRHGVCFTCEIMRFWLLLQNVCFPASLLLQGRKTQTRCCSQVQQQQQQLLFSFFFFQRLQGRLARFQSLALILVTLLVFRGRFRIVYSLSSGLKWDSFWTVSSLKRCVPLLPYYVSKQQAAQRTACPCLSR